jgi:serine/threonine-protein kinase
MDALDPETRLGTIVAGTYRIRALLGRGSMGFVYEVEHVESGRLGALKVLLPEVAQNPEIAARLAREGKAMSLLSHRNIVALLDAGTLDDGTPFIITELAGGTSLRAIMDAGPIEQRRALGIVRQILDALEHAHGHGIIHRDVKPDNVILDGDDQVKVLDFGVAKLVDDTRKLLGEAKLTQVGFELFGSPHYVAPEVVVGNAVDMRADVYSAGAVLFELLAGVPPFDDTDPVALLRLQAAAPVPTLAQRAPDRIFTPELELLVADALAKDPERRFPSAAAMAAALTRSLKVDEPVAIAPAAPNWIHRHKRASLLVGSGGMLVLLVALLAMHSSHQALPGAAKTADVSSQADADLARGATLDAVSEYERALTANPALATSAPLRSSLTTIAGGKDAVAAVIALDLLARSVSPPARDVIAAQASKHPSHEVRQRALAIAVRDGFADSVDRLDSYVLDLQQAKTCDERRAIIAKLRELGDARASAPLRRVKGQFPCIEHEATDALAALGPK